MVIKKIPLEGRCQSLFQKLHIQSLDSQCVLPGTVSLLLNPLDKDTNTVEKLVNIMHLEAGGTEIWKRDPFFPM